MTGAWAVMPSGQNSWQLETRISAEAQSQNQESEPKDRAEDKGQSQELSRAGNKAGTGPITVVGISIERPMTYWCCWA